MGHYSAFHHKAKLTLFRDEEVFITDLHIKLLKQVEMDGSINIAAKSLKMSYQHVWHLLDKMNKLSPVPLIIRQKGGRDGGGCFLSPFGKKVINYFDEMEKKLADSLEKMNEDIDSCFF